ncbi:MAG: hypothetical protein ABSH41_03375 [Syntrophobacteraceae bacterium]
MERLLVYLAKEWGVVSKAPSTFVILAVMMCTVAYLAARWLYKGIISNRDSEITLLKAQRDDYRDKLGGATPDQAKARIDDLETRIKAARQRQEPIWTPFIRVDASTSIPPNARSAKIQFKLWSDDNTIPLMIRIASDSDGKFMSEVTGPSGVVTQMIAETQAFYVSFSHPTVRSQGRGL